MTRALHSDDAIRNAHVVTPPPATVRPRAIAPYRRVRKGVLSRYVARARAIEAFQRQAA